MKNIYPGLTARIYKHENISNEEEIFCNAHACISNDVKETRLVRVHECRSSRYRT